MSTFKKFLAIGTVSAVSMMGAGVASAATPAGSTVSSHSVVAHVVKVKKVAFKGTYKGTIKLVWTSSTVTGKIIAGKGAATLMPASTMTGSGTGADTAYTDMFSGSGLLTGAGSTLKVTIVKTASSASVPDGTQSGPQSPPVTVTVIGKANVTAGTGKYKGASGTLKFSGSFSVSDSTAGTSESDAFTATLSGTLTVKN
jgi:hypothetical protein